MKFILCFHYLHRLSKCGAYEMVSRGYLLGNPKTDPTYANFQIPFAHGMALISDELYQVICLFYSCQASATK